MPASKIITWNGISSATIPEFTIGKITRSMLGSMRGELTEVAGKEGGWFAAERRGLRELRAECFIVVDDSVNRRATLRKVADWLDVESVTVLELSDEPGILYKAYVDDVSEIDEWREAGSFEIVWKTDPYGYSSTISTRNYAATSAVASTWTPPDNVYASPEIRVTADGGTITSLTVNVNGDIMVYVPALAITAGNAATISTVSFTVVTGAGIDTNLDGLFNPVNLDMSGITGDFGSIIPGLNSITLTRAGTATTMTVNIRWRRRYR